MVAARFQEGCGKVGIWFQEGKILFVFLLKKVENFFAV